MTYLQIANIYGYDPATVSRDWKARGLDISQTDEEIYQWVQDNVLTPLRGQTDLKEETQREQLRLAKAKADIEEMNADQLRRNLIEVDYVTESLSSYLLQLKNMLRSIPNTTYVELFSSEDANQLRETLKDKIDEVLRDIGNYEYGLAPIFPYTFYHLTHDWFVAADIPVANDTPVHYADAIRCNVRRPPQGSLPLLTRRVSA